MPAPRESDRDHDLPDPAAERPDASGDDDVREADPAEGPDRDQESWVDDRPERQAGG